MANEQMIELTTAGRRAYAKQICEPLDACAKALLTRRVITYEEWEDLRSRIKAMKQSLSRKVIAPTPTQPERTEE